jgi:hypothetical protein
VANKLLSNDFRSRLFDGPHIGMNAERAERLRQQELIRKVEAFEQTQPAPQRGRGRSGQKVMWSASHPLKVVEVKCRGSTAIS